MPTDGIEVLNALLKSEDDVTFHCGDHNIALQTSLTGTTLLIQNVKGRMIQLQTLSSHGLDEKKLH